MNTLPHADIGVIGGSGFYQLPGLHDVARVEVETPFGPPSGPIHVTEFEGSHVAFLARHGEGHVLPPHAVPYRANIFALKKLGVRRVVGVNAVGSLREGYQPGQLVMPDDVFDRTTGRANSFFEPGLVAHVDMSEPLCRTVRADLLSAAAHTEVKIHSGGTLVVIPGPRFSTRAESLFHRGSGFALVGMTTLPEATLAREAEMCYASLSLITDYDVWRSADEAVTADAIVRRLQTLTREAQALVRGALPALIGRGPCDCQRALDNAVITAPERRSREVEERLGPILARVLGHGR